MTNRLSGSAESAIATGCGAFFRKRTKPAAGPDGLAASTGAPLFRTCDRNAHLNEALGLGWPCPNQWRISASGDPVLRTLNPARSLMLQRTMLGRTQD